ncbi:unnamed protein product [Auanema sp. JU1783]|nr:unnamed protein product [Auanema sp. JU1783]
MLSLPQYIFILLSSSILSYQFDYRAVNDHRNFTSAQIHCKLLNSCLPSIHNEKSNEDLLEISKKFFPDFSFTWIGITTNESRWDDETHIDFSKFSLNYNDSSNGCLALALNGTWVRLDCYEVLPFFCQTQLLSSDDMKSPESGGSPGSQGEDDGGFPRWLIITLSVVGAAGLICCISWKCYFRFKKEIFEWKAFLIDRKNATIRLRNDNSHLHTIPNQYQNMDELDMECDDWEIEKSKLVVCENEMIGSGAFANVYLGHLYGEIPLVKRSGNTLRIDIQQESGTEHYQVAVKRLPPHATSDSRVDFKHEIRFMKSLGYHPHILSLLGVVTSVNSLIVVEFCESGDLLSYIRKQKDVFLESLKNPESDVKCLLTMKHLLSIAWQIADGLHYLASLNYIHRDIAARNVLLTKYMSAKIGDFGLCRSMETSMYTAKGGRLPIKWMAIESLRYYEYSAKSDVWSFGVLLYELYTVGQVPYQTVQPQDMPKYLEDGNRLPQPEICPNEIYEIMLKCWEALPDARLDIHEVREKLTMLLNSDSETYGYVDLKDLTNEVCPI